MFHQTATRTVPVTRELAEEFATMPAWKGERPLRAERVATLAKKIAAGQFYSPTWAVVTLDGVTYRMNGQHSSNALAACSNIPAGLQVTILEFRAETEQDLADLFAQFDIPESARRMHDVLNAHAATETAVADCPLKTLQVILAGIAEAQGSFGKDTHSERAVLMHTHGEFIEFARRFTTHRHTLYMAVVAAMYMTWKAAPQRSGEFWQLVASEKHPDANNATRVLARFLTAEVVGRSRRGGMRWDRRAVRVKCLHAWNAYWRKQSTVLKYVAEAPIPAIV